MNTLSEDRRTSAPARQRASGWQHILDGSYQLPWRIQPSLLFVGIWFGVSLLYGLHLSAILLFGMGPVWHIYAIVAIPFGLASLAFVKLPYRASHPVDSQRAWNRILALFGFWSAVTIFEIIYSQGVPLLWLLQHSPKNYTDFGLATLHGFDDSLLAALALAGLLLYLASGKYRYLTLHAFALFWSAVIINRDLIVVIAIESAVLVLAAARPKLRHWVTLFAATLGGIWLFGAIGDFRTGHQAFIALASPSASYPGWLPSGFLWGYIYLTASLNNLLLNVYAFHPLGSWFFPNTFALILPSVIRAAVYKNLVLVTRGILVTNAFNTSTAFASSYLDMGQTGIVLFAAATGLWCGWFWRGRGAVQTLSYCVLAQCAALSMFYDHFLYLPVIVQLLWFRLMFPVVRTPTMQLRAAQRAPTGTRRLFQERTLT